ncbi:5-hydroxyisourate hydrolase [Oopsacas minuta]|uniref:5-hydroxyisourate hydrolase n=1 Tax=Oopsacas minuta TaxID=111878 RepID=A0AAV7JVH8_9METZ|nr:5-hydroxyisourate hydrolase [Oopsacas minuta]
MSSTSAITTHVLDTSRGIAAQGLAISLYYHDTIQDKWNLIKHSVTNKDGRCLDLLQMEQFQAGNYKLTFQTSLYFEEFKEKSFFPFVEVIFVVNDPNSHFHVPLLLSPYSYTTYRGT